MKTITAGGNVYNCNYIVSIKKGSRIGDTLVERNGETFYLTEYNYNIEFLNDTMISSPYTEKEDLRDFRMEGLKNFLVYEGGYTNIIIWTPVEEEKEKFKDNRAKCGPLNISDTF